MVLFQFPTKKGLFHPSCEHYYKVKNIGLKYTARESPYFQLLYNFFIQPLLFVISSFIFVCISTHLFPPFPTYSNESFIYRMIFLYTVEGMSEVMERKRPRKLNLNAPLLSTRRSALGGHNITDKVYCRNSQWGWKDSSNGIPFCWEQAPGKPKNFDRSNNVDDAETPRPKPPPCRWRPPPAHNHQASSHGDHYDHDHHDEGCDADVDDYDVDDDNDDVFSNAVEVLSLTEAMDIVEKAEKFHASSDGFKSKSAEPSDIDGLNLESLEHSEHCPSPNFIIERFLPDATALAASSVVNISKARHPYLCNYSDQSPPFVSQAVTKQSSFSSPKGCGLEMLLPWRMKHKLCGVKRPIKESPSIVQPRTSAKQNKLFSSIVAPSGEWRCK